MKNLSITGAAILHVLAFMSLTVQGTSVVHDVNAQIILQEGRTILVYEQDGTFTVTEPGTVELLLVGGGGGGGQNHSSQGICGGGGGGGGGVVYKETFSVSAGTYNVAVGAGGDIGANGGNSSLSFGGSALVTAYGGGGGAKFGGQGRTGYVGKDGASGGGSSRGWTDTDLMDPGHAIHGASENLGHDGGQATHPYGPGGGGGAGEAGGGSSGSTPGKGGDGVACSIVAPGTYYGGGGAGCREGYTVSGGLGGGGAIGKAGVDGLGGGGSGGYRGGTGVVVVAFMRTVEPPVKDGWFEGTGGDEVLTNRTAAGREEIRVFRQNGTLGLVGHGTVEVLVVGGGGGGGITNSYKYGCGGGGAGGVVHYTNLVVSSGTYAITIGEGGGVGTNGYLTTGLGVLAYGGGAGGKMVGTTANDGASGGGGVWPSTTGSGGSTTNAGGRAIYVERMNKGHPGGGSNHCYGSGGGGGAGEAGVGSSGTGSTPGRGGNGYACDITGLSVYYGGGGGGLRTDGMSGGSGGLGGGGGVSGRVAHPGAPNTGGGGAGGMPGGSGIFIVRYMMKPTGLIIYFQ